MNKKLLSKVMALAIIMGSCLPYNVYANDVEDLNSSDSYKDILEYLENKENQRNNEKLDNLYEKAKEQFEEVESIDNTTVEDSKEESISNGYISNAVKEDKTDKNNDNEKDKVKTSDKINDEMLDSIYKPRKEKLLKEIDEINPKITYSQKFYLNELVNILEKQLKLENNDTNIEKTFKIIENAVERIKSSIIEINDDNKIKDYVVEEITNPLYPNVNNNNTTSNNSNREQSTGTITNHSPNYSNEDFSYNPPKSSEKLGSVKAADRPLESTPSNQSYYDYDKSMGYNFETSTPQSENNSSSVNVGASKIESKTSSADIKLVDKNKKPVSDIKVSLEKDNKVVGEAMSDQTGTIVLNALQKGNYKLKVLEVGQTFKAGQVFDIALKEDKEKKEFTIENNMVKITNDKKQKTYYEVYDGYTDKLLKKLESNDKGELVLNSLKYGAYYFVMGDNKSNTITVDKKFANATVNFDKNMKAKAVPVVQEDDTVEKGFIEGDKDSDKKLEQEMANQEVKSENKSKSPIKIVLGALAVALIGGGGFFLYKKKKGNNQHDIMDDFDL
ncbi:MAG: SpaA isopeptide-forming pilin-related protein [Finegoldia sp.]|uniref:SpaA isopeptide-forming pilin-related protein n=1 Tax=Finegoldia sp. TaxID=1981334 RepID=UPI00399633D3